MLKRLRLFSGFVPVGYWSRPLWAGSCLTVLLFQPTLMAETFSQANISSPTTQSRCVRDLPPAITTIIEQSPWRRSRWGMLVQTLAETSGIHDPSTLYSLNGEQYFLPASNAKLLTTAAALQALGPTFRFRTPVYGLGQAPVLTELRIVGSGDPTLTTAQLTVIAEQLNAQGIQRILSLVVQEGGPQEQAIQPTWEWEDIFTDYGMAVNRLILNGNAVTLTLFPQAMGERVAITWSDPLAAQQWHLQNHVLTSAPGTQSDVILQGDFGTTDVSLTGHLAADDGPDPWGLSIPHPAQYFLATLQQELQQQGIHVDQASVVHESNDQPGQKITEILSPTLMTLTREINQDSNNLYAEALRKALLRSPSTPEDPRVIAAVLRELGVDPSRYQLVDGSGLSRHNLVSPAALVEVLQIMAQSPWAKLYRDSLAIAGERGTLSRRFQNTAVAGKLWGKTGTLTGVSALSGYLTTADEQTLVISIIVNHADVPARQLRQAIDELVLMLHHVKVCPASTNRPPPKNVKVVADVADHPIRLSRSVVNSKLCCNIAGG